MNLPKKSLPYYLQGVLAVLLAIGGQISNQAAAQTAPINGQTWAYLVGAENYEKAGKLTYTVNDVRKLANALTQYGGANAGNIVTITDQEADRSRQPYQKSIMATLPEALKQAGPADTMIVYFSGHGFRDDAGKLYLAPLECDPANPVASGVPVAWVREQILACKAGTKLLILDACHAGADKGESSPSVSAKDIGDEFKTAAGVITLASSTADESSQIWQFKEQSLFSYWLTQGLKGHADTNGDGTINIDEIYEYVHGHVSQTAKVRFTRPQTPVRIVGPSITGVPTVLRLQPQALKQVVADMAEQLSGVMEERQLARLGVLEFTNDTKVGEMLGANFGLLGRYCSEELERNLTDRAAGKYQVVERSRLQEALKKNSFQLADFSSGDKLRQLSKTTGGMPVIARGTLFDRNGRTVSLRCKLVETEGDSTLASVGGIVQLNESEWGMLGRSVELAFNERFPAPVPGVEPVPIDDYVVNVADDKSRGPHPMENREFAFPLTFMVGGKQRMPVFKKVGEGNEERTECFLPVRAGEVLSIRVENRSGDLAMMRLLVDGLNTLPQKEVDKGVSTYVWGKRVNLADARAWILDPAKLRSKKKVWTINGFVTDTGAQGKLREFMVVDADQSLAARQKFTDQIGLITAAFYQVVPTNPGNTERGGDLGIGAGAERSADLTERNAEIGNMLSVVHIRYVDADTLKSH
ncbi:MAG: caspase family protein [Planctomycetota bacterium]|nr:caspase family protein [Planctomycetota bacterium]